jgi:hypothetical protein
MPKNSGRKYCTEPCPLCNGKNKKSRGAKSCWECRYKGFKESYRKCSVCGETLTDENWLPSSQYNSHNICKKCFSIKGKEKYKERKVWYKNKNYYLKKEVIEHYGGKCACCGVSDLVFLNLDHVNNDGNMHRRELKGSSIHGGGGGHLTYKWAKENGYPDTLQVLCFNCNWAKSHGGCPHQGKTEDFYSAVVFSGNRRRKDRVDKIHKCPKCGDEFLGAGKYGNHMRYKHPQAMEYGLPVPENLK